MTNRKRPEFPHIPNPCRRALPLLALLLPLHLVPRAAVAAPPPAAAPYTKNVAVVLYEGVEVLDFAGPAEVFASASGYGARGAEKAFRVYTVSRTRQPIVSQGFLHVTPDYAIDDAPPPAILVIPGGSSQNVTTDAAFMAWIKGAAAGADQVLTVCTGAFVAGRAGLLDGVEATTWYNAVPRLAKDFPATAVRPGRRFVDGGKVITTAGVSAGIDGSLHLVARLLGRYVADRTAEYMEYRWSPESADASRYTQWNPRLDARGRALQQAAIDLREGNTDAAIATYRALIGKDASDTAAWLDLARALHEQKRWDEAVAANQRAAAGAAERPTALFNLACAYSLLGQRDKALDALEKAFEAGVRTKWSFENDPDLAAVRDAPRFRALLARM